jgi:hypothetical protein
MGFEIVPDNELSQGLRRLRQLEALAGLPVAQRVIMRRCF